MDDVKKLKWVHIEDKTIYNLLLTLDSRFDPKLAFNLVECFHERMEHGLPYNQDLLLKFIQPIFAKIVSGQTPDVAMGFALAKGQYPRDNDPFRPILVYAIYKQLVNVGVTHSNAIIDTALELDLSEQTIRNELKSPLLEGFEYPDAILHSIYPIDVSKFQ